MKKSQIFRLYYLPVIVYAAVIFIFSCFHTVPLPTIDKLSTDKIYHAIEYSIFGYLIIRLVNFKLRGNKIWLVIVISILFGALYGISDEIHQYYVPGRYFSYWDMAADAAGCFIGCWIFRKYGHKTEKLFSFLTGKIQS